MKSKISKGRENRFYIGIISTAAILLVVFFTSKIWMYDDNPIYQTPFNTNISGLEQTVLRLNKWEYNPKKELMEVSINVEHKGTDIVKPTFTFQAKEKDSKQEYPVKIIYRDDNNFVVQIKKVPEKYRVIGLFVFENRDKKLLEKEYKERVYDETGTLYQGEGKLKIKLPEPSKKVLIGDYRKVKINEGIKIRTAYDYKKENIKNEIEQLVTKMSIISKDKISLQDQLVETLKDDIKSLEAEKEFQTNEEKQETKNQIELKNHSIEGALKEKKLLQEELKELKEKEVKLQEKMRSIEKLSNENEYKKTKLKLEKTKNVKIDPTDSKVIATSKKEKDLSEKESNNKEKR